MSFELAPVDGLDDEQLLEMANLFAGKCQKAAQQTVKDAVIAGNALNELKARSKHGEWRPWLRANFDYSFMTATTYMTLAANVKRFTFEPTSIRAALRAIADDRAEEHETDEIPKAQQIAHLKSGETENTPRSERKTGRVVVSDPVESKPAQKQPEDPASIKTELTNRKTSTENRKAREADRPVPAVITPEIVEEHEPEVFPEKTLADWSVAEMITFLKESADNPKRRAKELRKAADELDPPTKFRPPDVDEVSEFCRERKNKVDPEAFVAHYKANGWKLANGNKLADWKAAVITWERRDDSGNRNNRTNAKPAVREREYKYD